MQHRVQKRLTLVWLAAALVAACNGDSDGSKTPLPDGSVGSSVGDGGPSTPGGNAGSTGSSAGKTGTPGAAGSSGIADGGAALTVPIVNPGTPVPAPQLPTGAMVKRLVPGETYLIGGGADCNYQDAAADRWCGFARFSASDDFELWVINVTKALAGNVVCDGTDPNCLRLTDVLSDDDLSAHTFDGDTLIFETGALPANGTFRGIIQAWRPGWSKPRAITSQKGALCVGSTRSASVFCLENRTVTANALSFELHAGVLAATGVDGSLPLLDTITLGRTDGATGDLARFSASGDRLFYSSFVMPAAPAAQALYSYSAADFATPGKRTVVSMDAARPVVSVDGLKLFYLKGFNYDSMGASAGTLTMVDYPGGGNPVDVAARVGSYFMLGTDAVSAIGLAYVSGLNQGLGALKLVPDRSKPATVVDVASNVLFAGPAPSAGGLTYGKRVAQIDVGDPDNPVLATDFVFYKLDGSSQCTLQGEPQVDYQSWSFSNSGGLVFWREVNETSQTAFSGFFAESSKCGTRKTFAGDLGDYAVLPKQGFVYTELSAAFQVTAGLVPLFRLMYVPVTDGNSWPTTAPLKLYDRIIQGPQLMLGGAAVLFVAGPDAAEPGLYAVTGL